MLANFAYNAVVSRSVTAATTAANPWQPTSVDQVQRALFTERSSIYESLCHPPPKKTPMSWKTHKEQICIKM
jgi:hypothetical protein